MNVPPTDPRHRSARTPIGWRAVFLGFAVSAAFPVLFWALSRPLTAVVVIAVGLATIVAGKRLVTAYRREHDGRWLGLGRPRASRRRRVSVRPDGPN